MTLAGRGDMRLRTVVDEDGSRVLRTLVNRALLAGIGAAFLVAAAVLLAAPDGSPAVAGETGLFDVLGFGGLFVGSVLLFRVVAAVAARTARREPGAGRLAAAQAPAVAGASSAGIGGALVAPRAVAPPVDVGDGAEEDRAGRR